jgi:hypothetical protein
MGKIETLDERHTAIDDSHIGIDERHFEVNVKCHHA